jgi:hypothetical protein
MTIDEVAAILDGRQYCDEVDSVLRQQLIDNNLVVVYGGSDDIMMFDGSIREELYGKAYVNDYGLLINECEDDDCPYYEQFKSRACYVKPIWHDDVELSWTYETNIPTYATFTIMDGVDKYCQGIVFDLGDVYV